MATYLQDGVGVFPEERGFTPNYNFIMRALEMRQQRYNENFNHLKGIYNTILGADMTGDDNIQRRDEIIKNARKALQDLPMVDLSIPKNATAAESVFKPFYEDTDILNDINFTKQSKNNLQSGMALQNAEKEEDRKRYWNYGVQDIYDGMEEFKNATPEQRLNMRARRYVAKPQVGEEILKMFNEGKLKRSYDELSGQVKYTTENGQQLITPITNLYLSRAMNDPETMEGFNVYGRVTRNNYIRTNVQNGKYKTREEAASAHDNLLVQDYIELQDKRISETNKVISTLNDRIKIWNGKISNATITDEEKVKLAQDELELERLKKQIIEFGESKAGAKEKITSNPTAYLGNIYLHKSANDLATALSAFGSQKVTSNDVYKDFVQPFTMEQFKTQQSMILEDQKHQHKMAEEKFKAELKELYGGSEESDGTSGSGSSSEKKSSLKLNELNIPEVTQDAFSSGVSATTEKGVGDAYRQQLSQKMDLVADIAASKARFIVDALDPTQIVAKDGKTVLDQNQIRNLSKNPDDLDRLYKIAVDKYNTVYNQNDPTGAKSQMLRTSLEAINKKYDVWNATNAYTTDKLKNIIANLEANVNYSVVDQNNSADYQQYAENVIGRSRGKEKPLSYDAWMKREGRSTEKDKPVAGTPAKGTWIYKHLLNNGILVNDDENGKNIFVKNVQSDPNFKTAVQEKYVELVNRRLASTLIPGYGAIQMARPEPTLKQAETELIAEYRENLTKYKTTITDVWNKQGLNYFAAYSGGGGGETSATLTYRADKNITGEKADKYTQDLLGTLPSLNNGTDFVVTTGPNKIKGYEENDKELAALIQNGPLSNEVLNAIKLGKSAVMDYYSISMTKVGGGNPNYHAYHLKFDPKFISGLQSGETKTNMFTPATAGKLLNGITIYVKKDSDKSMMSAASHAGEIDILLNSSPTGTIKKEIAPNYNLEINKNPLTGGYRIKYTFLSDFSPTNLQGTPKEEEIIVPPSSDLSATYYEVSEKLYNRYLTATKAVNNFTQQQNKVQGKTPEQIRAEVDALKNQATSSRPAF